ncbi:MAG: hypothetical protein JST79_03755 [Acidobacteria bacterium]|nr:hypothetical protein [Acidobacteriota bacterium]
MKAALFIFSLLLATAALAQTPADITSEAHHSLLLQNEQVRVFGVRLKPGEQAFVRREHSFMLVTLQDCELVIWREGRSAVQSYQLFQGDVRFFYAGRALGVRNDRNSTYRGVVVEFLDANDSTYGYQPGLGGYDYGDSVLRPPVDPHAKFANSISFGAATAIDVQLLPGDPLEAPEKPAAELWIPVTDVDLKSGEYHRVRKSAADVTWIDPGRKIRFINADNGPIRLTVVRFEVREEKAAPQP